MNNSLRGFGGDEGNRTLDLGVANAALSQLSYIPTKHSLFHNKLYQSGQFKKVIHNILTFLKQGKGILFRCSVATACFSWKPTDCLKGVSTR
jgi:hypothetical protein